MKLAVRFAAVGTVLALLASEVSGQSFPSSGKDPDQLSSAEAASMDYFALGDSVASGHGLSDDHSACRRSEDAYPWRVLERLQAMHEVLNFGFFACSGATTASIDDQITQVLSALSGRPTMVSITVGANDFDWTSLEFVERLCDPDETTFLRWVADTEQEMASRLTSQLGRIPKSDSITMVLTDYHNPTNRSADFWIGLVPGCRQVEVYDRSELVIHSMNRAIGAVQRRLGQERPGRVHLASIHGVFHGHESPRAFTLPSCGTAPPNVSQTWIQYFYDPASNSLPIVGGDCIHPNREGARAIAEAVSRVAPALVH